MDENLRRLERDVAGGGGGREARLRLAVESIRRGGGPEAQLREILERANQATFAMARLRDLRVDEETMPHMALPFEAVREIVTITAGDPKPRLFAHSAMPVNAGSFGEHEGETYPVALALAVRDAANDAVTVGVIVTGSPWSSPLNPTLGSVGWWTYQDRTPKRGSISDLSREKRLWVSPEISTYPLVPPAGKRLTQLLLDWSRRGPDHDPYAGSDIQFPIQGLLVRIDLPVAEAWSSRHPDDATTDERLQVAEAVWLAYVKKRPLEPVEELVGFSHSPRTDRFAREYVAQWKRFSGRPDPLFPRGNL